MRARVGTHDHITFAKAVPQFKVKRAIPVVSRVLQQEPACRRAGWGVVDEAVGSVAFEKFGLQVNGPGEFFFESETPVHIARRLKCASVNEKRSEQWRRGRRRCTVHIRGFADRVEEVVCSLAGKRTGDQKQRSRIVDDSNSCGDLCVAFVVKHVSPSQSRRDQHVTDDLIPIETQSGLNQQTVANEPTVLGIRAAFEVVDFRKSATRKC